ncbi:MAG: hypothetical protein JNG88_04040 [Phycisphaerales bacterium]|nr:hypothetical protein [Phycisphaerales bacterium]
MRGGRDKQKRQADLLRLVRQRRLTDQQQIVRLMRSRGFDVTQASVSRDVRELGLVKADGRYVQLSEIAQNRTAGDLSARIDGLVTSVEPAGANLVVVRTAIGSASTVAVALDEHRLPDTIGTIAGDDTIFIAVRSRNAQGRVVSILKSAIPRYVGYSVPTSAQANGPEDSQ